MNTKNWLVTMIAFVVVVGSGLAQEARITINNWVGSGVTITTQRIESVTYRQPRGEAAAIACGAVSLITTQKISECSTPYASGPTYIFQPPPQPPSTTVLVVEREPNVVYVERQVPQTVVVVRNSTPLYSGATWSPFIGLSATASINFGSGYYPTYVEHYSDGWQARWAENQHIAHTSRLYDFRGPPQPPSLGYIPFGISGGGQQGGGNRGGQHGGHFGRRH